MDPTLDDRPAGAVSFEAPGPGRWELDRSHYPGGTTPISQWLISEAMGAGMSRVFAELGVPAARIDARFVNGFFYSRMVPLLGGGAPPTRLPPRIVLKVVSRLHPQFRARRTAARHALDAQTWRPVLEQWHRELRPGLLEQNSSFQAVPLSTLDDVELARHLAELLAHARRTFELHFWLHGYDLGPIAQYLTDARDAGVDPAVAVRALQGASPVTVEPVRLLRRLRALVEASGRRPAGLDEVRAVSAEADAALTEYLDRYGALVVTGYDVDALTLAELPGVVLASILEAPEPGERTDGGTVAEVLDRVPGDRRAAVARVLEDARTVMDLRDDNGPMTAEWPVGLLRRALLEAGRRLAARGRLVDAEHALELEPAEVGPLVSAGMGPRPEQLAARAARRAALAVLHPPPSLGPEEPAPPLDVLPDPLPKLVAMVQLAIEQLDMGAARDVDPLVGVGIGSFAYRGRVRRASSPEEAIDTLEPGDVLVVRATSPAFNAVLALAGGIVTADGGPLSHAAVLARELGIPAVIGAKGALDLPDGAEVELDPATGRVRVMDPGA